MSEDHYKDIELGNYCVIHKAFLREDGTCYDCEIKVPAWRPPTTQKIHMFFPLRKLPFGLIFWYIVCIALSTFIIISLFNCSYCTFNNLWRVDMNAKFLSFLITAVGVYFAIGGIILSIHTCRIKYHMIKQKRANKR